MSVSKGWGWNLAHLCSHRVPESKSSYANTTCINFVLARVKIFTIYIIKDIFFLLPIITYIWMIYENIIMCQNVLLLLCSSFLLIHRRGQRLQQSWVSCLHPIPGCDDACNTQPSGAWLPQNHCPVPRKLNKFHQRTAPLLLDKCIIYEFGM